MNIEKARLSARRGVLSRSWPVVVFTAFYLAIATVVALRTDSKEFLLYFAGAPFLIWAIALVHKRVQLPVTMLWGMSLLGLFHTFGGLVMLPESAPTEGKPLLYNLWLVQDKLKYDNVVHIYGNALATWFCWNLLRYTISVVVKRDIREIPARPIFLLICFLAGVGVGALNELMEFGATQTVPGDTNVGGYVNTGWDFVCNTVGGLITIFILWLKRRGKPLPAPSRK
jgi:hypothetical protein